MSIHVIPGQTIFTEVMVPSLFYINAINLGQMTTVQFTENHDYSLGEYISFRVSPPYGTFELNNQKAIVQKLTPNTITVAIDSTNYTPFVYPVAGANTPPVCVPAGSGIIPGTATMNLEDCFDTLDPQWV
jgi:hypothetical protein